VGQTSGGALVRKFERALCSKPSGGVEADTNAAYWGRFAIDGFAVVVCLAISWLSRSFVIGRHRTLSPVSAPRKGMISNDDDRRRHPEGRGGSDLKFAVVAPGVWKIHCVDSKYCGCLRDANPPFAISLKVASADRRWKGAVKPMRCNYS
jgi:hypothetical protein